MPRRFRCLSGFVLMSCSIFGVGCQRPVARLYDTRAWEGVTYVERAGRPLKMDIVAPKTDIAAEHRPRPAVLMVHGGSWAIGERRWMRASANFLAGMGFVSATIDYRLSPDGAKYPDPVCDCLAAVKFLRKNAATYGIDPRRIAIGGDSAGGHLALLVGLTKNPSIYGDDSYPGVSSEVAAIVDIYGPTDMVKLHDQCPFIVRPDLHRFMGGDPQVVPARWKEASPISHIRADAPPVLILHGDDDHVVDYRQAVEFDKALRAAGGQCHLVRVTGAEHGWCLFFEDKDSLRTLPALVRFLSETLGTN